jgi:protoporphyrinogen oxidase/ferrochelatase
VIVMSYGSPATPDDVLPYYTHIRRGRPPTDEQLADLRRRYDAIGGVSPLFERTDAQRAAIQRALDAEHGDGAYVVKLGQKHAPPFLEEVVTELATADAVDAIVGLVLAPHYSKGSVGEYHERAAETASGHGVTYLPIDSWHLEPAYVDFLATALGDARASVPDKHKVLFTAHSLPKRVLVDDPYPVQLRESATAIATKVGLSPWYDWALGWQSAGRTPEPWAGPDILEIIRDLAETERSEGVVVCAQGFTSDHLEVLFDLDIEATEFAAERGLAFARTRSINDDDAVMGALAGRIAERAAPTATAARLAPPEPPTKSTPTNPSRRVVVIGGGIAGLTAAYCVARDHVDVHVTVVDADDRVGGKIRTSMFDGRPIDEAADAFLARVPDAKALCDELGLGYELVSPADSRAFLFTGGELRPFPEGGVLGVPTDLDVLAASRIVDDDAVARARRDLDEPGEPLTDDESVGAFVRRRIGDQVFERLVAPILGGVNAGDADELSIELGAPQLAVAGRRPGSLIEELGAQRDAALAAAGDEPAPVFFGLRGGTQDLTDRLRQRIEELGGIVTTGTRATAIDAAYPPGRHAPLYTVRLDESHGVGALHADAVVIATDAPAAAALLRDRSPSVSDGLGAIEYASVVLVTLAVPADALARPLDGSGFLVPRDEGLTITACSWASTKWAHLASSDGTALLRVSLGHAGDDTPLVAGDDKLRATVLADLERTGVLRDDLDADERDRIEVRLSRWPDALPQFRPGHLGRVDEWERRLARDAPGIVLAGAHLRGLGIPACVASGQRAATAAAPVATSATGP